MSEAYPDPACSKLVDLSDIIQPISSEDAETLQAQYERLDTKLLDVEEELDFLLQCADTLRQERTALAKEFYTKHPLHTEKTHTLSKAQRSTSESDLASFMEEYLKIGAQGQTIGELIKSVKGECASLRHECTYIQGRIKRCKKIPTKPLTGTDSLAHGYPESGFSDPMALAERIITADSTATSVANVVGALGASIAYTTLFSATRGRLDLISWSLSCFLLVLIDSAALQIFMPTHHSQVANIFRMEYVGSVENRLVKFMIFVGLPMIAGFLLLAASVVFMDPNSSNIVIGSKTAILAAGCLPLVALGYFVCSAVVAALVAAFVRITPRRFRRAASLFPEKHRNALTSVISPIREKLYFLPGGTGYPLYRQRRRDRAG